MLWTDLAYNNRLFDPWREFEKMNRLMSFYSPRRSYEFPAVNIWVAPDKSLVTTEIPGIEPKDIEISVMGKNLTLRGARKAGEMKESESSHRKERWHGEFSRTIELPFNVEPSQVHATFKKGVLYITLPRAEEERPRKIEVK